MLHLGSLNGLPVFLLRYYYEYQAIDNNEERFYVAEGRLFYKGIQVGTVNNNKQVTNFDEERFNELRAKGWYQENADLLGRVTGVAETRPQEEEKPVNEVPETGCGNSLIDEFMASWRDNIDNEIAKLKLTVAEMENVLNAVD